MKISITNESISVGSDREPKFRATVRDITEVRVMADKAVPKTLIGRFKHYVGGATPEIKLRSIMIWAGEKAVTLDAYYDEPFEAAFEWFSRHGWNMQSAVANAVKTPLVRVTVERR